MSAFFCGRAECKDVQTLGTLWCWCGLHPITKVSRDITRHHFHIGLKAQTCYPQGAYLNGETMMNDPILGYIPQFHLFSNKPIDHLASYC